jgi:hypothetical protein
MPSLNALVKFVFTIIQLFTHGSSRKAEDGRVSTDLVPVWLQFDRSDRTG